MNEEAKKITSEAKNICLIPSENEPESSMSCLALFYTLKELGKNVNLVADSFPERANFLVPSIDFISSPKNFVISIPKEIADISQIYYEKTDESLKIHLTADKGNLKKENIVFYFQEAKPDLVVTLGIQNFKEQLGGRFDSFGFLLDSPILNIDNSLQNLRFGQINLIEQKSLSEITFDLIRSIGEDLIKKDVANCLLAGIIIYYQNFKSKHTNEAAFQAAAELIRKGADNQQIIDNLCKTNEKEMDFLGKIFQNLKIDSSKMYVAALKSVSFENFSESHVSSAVEKIKNMGVQNDLLVLWESHASGPVVKGFFYSKKQHLIDLIAKNCRGANKGDWVFLAIPGENIDCAKEQIVGLLQ